MLTKYYRRPDGEIATGEVRSPCCDAELTYQGDFGAPGYGKSYDCSKCGTGYCWLGRWNSLTRSVPEFTAADVE